MTHKSAAEKKPLAYLLLPGLAGGMTGGDVADLVCQHGGELVLVVQMTEHPPRDVNIAARKRHGVDDWTVQDTKSNRSIAKLRLGSGAPKMTGREHAISDLRDIALQLGIVVKAKSGRNFLARLLADCGFLLPGVAQILPLTGGGNITGSTAE